MSRLLDLCPGFYAEESDKCAGCGRRATDWFDCAKCGERHCFDCGDYHAGPEPECVEAKSAAFEEMPPELAAAGVALAFTSAALRKGSR